MAVVTPAAQKRVWSLRISPAVVGGAAFAGGGGELLFMFAGGAVLVGEEDAGVFTDDFFGGPAEDAGPGAGVPAGDVSARVGGEDAVIAYVLDEQAEARFALAQGIFYAFSGTQVPGDPGEADQVPGGA